MKCANCGSTHVKTSVAGLISPFFLKRVHGMHAPSLAETLLRLVNNKNRGLRGFLLKILNWVVSQSVFGALASRRPTPEISIQACKTCLFVGPLHVYSSQELSALYQDYRSESYNQERICYEPGYNKIQHLVGKDSLEIRLRLAIYADLMNTHVPIDRIRSVLDWGGGEGRFIPESLHCKQVEILDISTEPLHDPRFTRIDVPIAEKKYDYIQACHILEHVGSPLALLQEIVSYLERDGYIYLEVPQDRSRSEIMVFSQDGPHHQRHLIHEHLNLYCQDSLRALGCAAGLHPIYLNAHTLPLDQRPTTIVCGLFKRKK